MPGVEGGDDRDHVHTERSLEGPEGCTKNKKDYFDSSFRDQEEGCCNNI